MGNKFVLVRLTDKGKEILNNQFIEDKDGWTNLSYPIFAALFIGNKEKIFKAIVF